MSAIVGAFFPAEKFHDSGPLHDALYKEEVQDK
jgi:hypothetical protein